MRTHARPPIVIVLFALVFGMPAMSAQTAQQTRDRTAAVKACADARKTETIKAEAERAKRMEDANAKETIGFRNCQTDKACKDKVTQTWRDEVRKIQNDYTQAVADIRKREIDCNAGVMTGKPVGSGPMYELAAQIDAIRNSALDNVLGAADNLFKGLLDWASGTLKFLAQPRGDFDKFGAPMQQILDYLVNHKPTSFEDQYKKMEAAVQQFQQNPARFIGQQIPNLIPGGTATQEMNAVSSAARRLAVLNAEAKQFVPLARKLTTPSKLPTRNVTPPPLTVGTRPPVNPPAGSLDRPLPPSFGNEPPRPRSGVPTTCYENQCWRNVQAVDRFWKTGVWNEPTPRGYPLVEELHDLPTPVSAIIQDLRKQAGGAQALDPRHGPLGQQAHAHGIPVASSRGQIEDVMGQLPPGSQGYAFIDWEMTVGNEVIGGGHVVNVRTLQNQTVEFFDRATQQTAGLLGAVDPQIWNNAKQVYFFLTHEGR